MLKEILQNVNEMRRGRVQKVKPLNSPLTDTEIKKLASYRKNLKTKDKYGRIKLTKMSRGWENYQNLLSREKVPQKKFELKTIAQISKMDRRQNDALRGIARYALGRDLQGALKYLNKSDTLKLEDEQLFLDEYGAKIKKMYKSPQYKKLIIKNLYYEVEQNNYNMEIPASIRDWVLSIITKDVPSEILFFDGYKLYQNLEVDKFDDSWSSYQGAQMTTKKAKVIFSYDKDYTKEFDLGTSGVWMDS